MEPGTTANPAHSVGAVESCSGEPGSKGFRLRCGLRGSPFDIHRVAQTKGQAREPNMQNLVQLLRNLERQRYYGSLEIKFEGGKVVLLRKTETIKLAGDNCRTNRGKQDGQH